MTARTTAALVVGGLFGVLAACSNETIVLATLDDDDGDAGAGRRTYVKCTKNADCATDQEEYCDIDRQDLAIGHCAHKPLICNDTRFHPVCAPSGISYFNDCYRRKAGEPTAVDGECVDNPRICDLTKTFCPAGSTCELLGGGVPGDKVCGQPVGRCWGILSCPPPDPDDHDGWDECSTEGGALRCVDTCRAVQSGRPFTRHDRCR